MFFIKAKSIYKTWLDSYLYLYLYVMTRSALPKLISLKTKVITYNSKILRNLEESEILLITYEDSDGRTNSIIEFISGDLKSQLGSADDNIQIKNIEFSVDEITKNFIEHNYYFINYNKNWDLFD